MFVRVLPNTQLANPPMAVPNGVPPLVRWRSSESCAQTSHNNNTIPAEICTNMFCSIQILPIDF
jgi:hypothetical protein